MAYELLWSFVTQLFHMSPPFLDKTGSQLEDLRLTLTATGLLKLSAEAPIEALLYTRRMLLYRPGHYLAVRRIERTDVASTPPPLLYTWLDSREPRELVLTPLGLARRLARLLVSSSLIYVLSQWRDDNGVVTPVQFTEMLTQALAEAHGAVDDQQLERELVTAFWQAGSADERSDALRILFEYMAATTTTVVTMPSSFVSTLSALDAELPHFTATGRARILASSIALDEAQRSVMYHVLTALLLNETAATPFGISNLGAFLPTAAQPPMRRWMTQLPLNFMHRLAVTRLRSSMRRRLSTPLVGRRLVFESSGSPAGTTTADVTTRLDLDVEFPLTIEEPIYSGKPVLNQYLRSPWLETPRAQPRFPLLELLDQVPSPARTSATVVARLRTSTPWLWSALVRAERAQSARHLQAIERAVDGERMSAWLDEVRSDELRGGNWETQTPADRVNAFSERWKRGDGIDFYASTFYVALLFDYYAHMQLASTDRIELFGSDEVSDHVLDYLESDDSATTIENVSPRSSPGPSPSPRPRPGQAVLLPQRSVFDYRWSLEAANLLRALYDWSQRRGDITTPRMLFERMRRLERARAQLVDSEAKRIAEAAVMAVRCALVAS